MPTMASYSASKHALEGASEALWYETRPYGIKVSLVEPGFINSSSYERTILSRKAQLCRKLHGPMLEFYSSMEPFIEKMMRSTKSTSVKIARKIESLLHAKDPPLHVPITADAAILYYSKKLIPLRLLQLLMFRFFPGANKWGKHPERDRKFVFLRVNNSRPL